jgi:hypothetical protein
MTNQFLINLRLFACITITILYGCNEISDKKNIELIEKNNQSNLNKELKKGTTSPLVRLNLKPIDKLNSKTLRIWKYPGGGSAVRQILEFNDSILTYYSYVINGYENRPRLSKFNFIKHINEKEIKEELELIISDSGFMKTKNSNKYCEEIWDCSDSYLIEFTNGKETMKFSMNEDIENCDNKQVENSKKIYKIVNQIINKYSS